MIKAAVIHGDKFKDFLMINSVYEIKSEWWKWRNKYDTLSLTDNLTAKDIVEKIQAWHNFCAVTSVLKELDLFDMEKSKPKTYKE